jgi:hypothetical protein
MSTPRVRHSGRFFLVVAVIVAIVAISLASNLDAAANGAISTKMSPAAIRLAPSASTVITVSGTAVPMVNGVQVGLRYDPTIFRVDNAESVGLFTKGWTLPATTTASGERVMGSFLLQGYTQGTGPVMKFRVTRLRAGYATVQMVAQGPWATQYSVDGTSIEAGSINTLYIY